PMKYEIPMYRSAMKTVEVFAESPHAALKIARGSNPEFHADSVHELIEDPDALPRTPCSACGGSEEGPPMYRACIDQVQRDNCYTCKGTGTTAPSDGSMLRCYWAFLEYFPWKKSEFPTYDLWVCSDADDARTFRQGWAARCSALESLQNDPVQQPAPEKTL